MTTHDRAKAAASELTAAIRYERTTEGVVAYLDVDCGAAIIARHFAGSNGKAAERLERVKASLAAVAPTGWVKPSPVYDDVQNFAGHLLATATS